jgi:hypothetical protein
MKKIFLLFLLLCISIYTQATTISFASTVTGKTTLKAVICNLSAMTVWDTNATAFGATSTVTWAHRAITVTEDTNNTGVYYFTIPAGVSSAGNYFVRIYDSGDGTLNIGDSIFDGKQFPLDWSGASEINLTSVNTDLATADDKIDSVLADSDELQAEWANGGRLDLLLDAILEDTGTTLPTLADIVSAILANPEYPIWTDSAGRVRTGLSGF